ncbi:hypothetical protein [Arthrobacter sp. MMS18-M83]|uniref:hypothetical protein n=1 Tax=Arthrobacter sp. MMS18-M83 TaxID=2996261 RepID=UPI00227ADA78|nr:hypothetical protein [Arthrobacter sp. MMS18-M83]WAH96524.1 hypothetical protein OW521_19285 [Arthrobacter sp. MMS18-M83]
MSTAINDQQHLRRRSSARAPRGEAGPGPQFRHARGILAFAIVAGTVIALRTTGLLQGTPALIVTAVLLLLLPTARVMSKRILFNGLILAGLVPLTWWLPERLMGTDHGTLVLAGLAGVIAWWIGSAKLPARRVRRLVPSARWIDSIPFLSALLSALSLGTMLTIRSPLDALSILTSRWDYQSHFSIYYMIRLHGEVIPTIPQTTAGDAWGFSEYPQGFHALLATMSDLLRPSYSSVDSELVGFMNLQAACSVMTVLIVAAGLCALPAVRRRAGVMASGIAIAMAAWIYGPGAIPAYEGFANFYLACGMATATVLALLTFQRRVPVVGVAVVGAGLVSICNNWLLLVSLLAVVLWMKVWTVVRQRGSYNRRWWILSSACISVSMLGMALPIIQISPLIEQSQHILEAQGGIAYPDFGLALVAIVLALVLGFANRSLALRIPSSQLRTERLDVSRAATGLFIPIALCIWLAVSQTVQNGAISYYFYKYLIAVLLLAWPLAVAAAASLIPPAVPSEGPLRKHGLTLALCVLAITATQVFGFSVPGLQTAGLPATVRPLTEMSNQQARLQSTPAFVPRLLQSARQPQPASTVYIPGPGTVDPILAARWQWGMRGMSSSRTTDLSFDLVDIVKDYDKAPEIIGRILAHDPALYAIVDPELFEPVHQYLLSLGPGVADRLIRLG